MHTAARIRHPVKWQHCESKLIKAYDCNIFYKLEFEKPTEWNTFNIHFALKMETALASAEAVRRERKRHLFYPFHDVHDTGIFLRLVIKPAAPVQVDDCLCQHCLRGLFLVDCFLILVWNPVLQTADYPFIQRRIHSPDRRYITAPVTFDYFGSFSRSGVSLAIALSVTILKYVKSNQIIIWRLCRTPSYSFFTLYLCICRICPIETEIDF